MFSDLKRSSIETFKNRFNEFLKIIINAQLCNQKGGSTSPVTLFAPWQNLLNNFWKFEEGNELQADLSLFLNWVYTNTRLQMRQQIVFEVPVFDKERDVRFVGTSKTYRCLLPCPVWVWTYLFHRCKYFLLPLIAI